MRGQSSRKEHFATPMYTFLSELGGEQQAEKQSCSGGKRLK